jgi:capsular polysaccharide biosynthesis protein
VIVFFLEWLEAGVIRTPEDLERQLDLTVVGAIPSTK